MANPEHFEIFWEKKDSFPRSQIESTLFHSIEAVFPGSFVFSLPGAGEQENGSFTFLDPSGDFSKAVVLETAGPGDLEAILQSVMSFKREAETFFKGKNRIFQPGIGARLVLFAKDFEPEFTRLLRFYSVKASLFRLSMIEGGERMGILLRRAEEIEPEAKEERQQPRSFFEAVPLTREEEDALGKLRPLLRDRSHERRMEDQRVKEGGRHAIF